MFVGPFEHHSNLLPWKELGAEVRAERHPLASRLNYVLSFNPLIPGAFYQKCIFFFILELFSPEMGQISPDVLKKAFAT